MGANQSSHQPEGTDFKSIQKERQKYGNVDLPEIPLNKMREVQAEVDMTVKQSKYIVEYKREVRDALKRKKAKGREPKLFRLQNKCLHPADDAAGKEDNRKALIKLLVENVTPVVEDDVIDSLKQEGHEGNLEKKAADTIYKLIHERVNELIYEAAERIMRRYQKGEDYMLSDEEEDEAELEARRAERRREDSKKRKAEADAWFAELHGEAPPPAAEGDDDEEEEEEEEEEETDEE